MADLECRQEYIRRIHKVQDYIEQHIGQTMTVDELSNAAGFSKYHFSRIFQSMLHEPLSHYVNRIRMERALFLIAHRMDKSMTDIAYELGFTDSAIFSRAFRNYHGISPREYRREYSKNCKDSFLLSEYNKATAKKAWESNRPPVIGQMAVTSIEEKQLVYVRHTGTYETLAREYANMMQALFSEAARQELLDGKNWTLAIYHDNPEFGDQNQFRTSLCVTVPSGKQIEEGGVLGKMKLIGGLYAVGHFEIQAEQYGDAWDYMYQVWLTGSGYVPRSADPFEVYCNNPDTDPHHISKVDIYVPIEPITF